MTTQREKSDRQNAKVDEKILRLIHELRNEYQACTLRHLASHMRITETAVRNRMNRMRGQYLDWNKMPGSVHLLPAGYERAGIVVVDVELEAATPAPVLREPEAGVESVEDQVSAAVAAGVAAALEALGITATTSAPAGPSTGEPDPATPAHEDDSSRTS